MKLPRITFSRAVQCGPINNGEICRVVRLTVEQADEINALLNQVAALPNPMVYNKHNDAGVCRWCRAQWTTKPLRQNHPKNGCLATYRTRPRRKRTEERAS